MATPRRPCDGRSRPSPLSANLEDCLAEFDPVTQRYGLALRSRTVETDGFSAEYWKEDVGVRLAYHVRDPFTVDICFADGVPVSDDPPLVLRCVDLLDVAAAAGLAAPLPRDAYYPVPDRRTAATLAQTLREAAGPLLEGDRSILPDVVERIRARFRTGEG